MAKATLSQQVADLTVAVEALLAGQASSQAPTSGRKAASTDETVHGYVETGADTRWAVASFAGSEGDTVVSITRQQRINGRWTYLRKENKRYCALRMSLDALTQVIDLLPAE